MKRIMIWLGYVLLGILVFGLIYFSADAVLSRISLNKQEPSHSKAEIPFYVLSNGVHTDLVLPIKVGEQDWSKVFPIDHTKGKSADHRFIAIGWGDKGFYLNTPEWKDLTLKTALIAGLGIGETALHVTYYRNMSIDEQCRKLMISQEQYQALTDFILASLDRNAQGDPIYIQTNAQYGMDDAFYEAKGAYSLFYSCNTWSNQALKRANLPAAVWTVFDKGILRHYR